MNERSEFTLSANKSTQRIIVSRVQNSKEPQSKHVPFVNLLNSFSPDLVNEIVQLSRRMNSSVPETIEMTLRNAFCLRVPQKWMRDSWVQGGGGFWLNKRVLNSDYLRTNSLSCAFRGICLRWECGLKGDRIESASVGSTSFCGDSERGTPTWESWDDI